MKGVVTVDRVAAIINGPVQIGPATLYLDIVSSTRHESLLTR